MPSLRLEILIFLKALSFERIEKTVSVFILLFLRKTNCIYNYYKTHVIDRDPMRQDVYRREE